MKIFFTAFLLFFISTFLRAQVLYDKNNDGKIDNGFSGYADVRGNGIPEYISVPDIKNKIPARDNFRDNITFSLFWSSPQGAFTNCNDGLIGYFDGDTLLDIAGYTFSPGNTFYIWKQSPSKPDSFALVFSEAKVEFGGYGPMTAGDVDGDGKTEIILADYSTMSRVYVFTCLGNGQYVNRNTQSSLTHTNNGETSQALLIGDMNKNGQKEIICMRGNLTTGGELRIWEHTGSPGTYAFTNLFNYTTVSYLFGRSGYGDSDGDGWDEVFLTYGGSSTFNTNIRRIKYDSASGTFVHLIYTATTIGFPACYKVADINNDGTKELIATAASNNNAACFIFRTSGVNQYNLVSTINETDPNTMTCCDVKLLAGDTYPSILMSSFGGKVFVYQYNGTNFVKTFEKLDYPGSAIQRVYWTNINGVDGYFNTWSSTNSNGTFYILKRTLPSGISEWNENIPKGFELFQNYPNPFNPTTNIKYQIPPFNSPLVKGGNGGVISLKIYNILGKEVATLVNEFKKPGTYEIQFPNNKYTNNQLPSGIYYYTLIAGDFKKTMKLILLK